MKASDLKKILEVPLSVGKAFTPITEYIYFKDSIIKSTNMESYLEMSLNESLPFQGCVLAEPLKKFLDSVNKDTELTFEVNKSILTILYGKKNKFSVPMEDLDNFPESPKLKYSDESFITSIILTQDFIENIERSVLFSSDNDSAFNGVFLNNNKIYSSNREIIYVGNPNENYDIETFIPKNLLKFLLKFKELYMNGGVLKFYKEGFQLKTESSTLYFPTFVDIKIPNFDNVVSEFISYFEIPVTEELKSSIDRFKKLGEVVVNITNIGNTIKFISGSDNIEETIEYPEKEIPNFLFKASVSYLKMILDMQVSSLDLFTKKDTEQVKAFGGSTEKDKPVSYFDIVAATMV